MKKINLSKHYTFFMKQWYKVSVHYTFMKQWYKVGVHYMEKTMIILTKNIEGSTLVWHYIS